MSEDHSTGAVRPGRYEGGSADVGLMLRVDAELGVISGDLSQVRPTFDGSGAVTDYVASLRTALGSQEKLGLGSFTIVGEDTLGQVSVGRLVLKPGGGPDRLTVTLQFDRRVAGLPFRRPFEVTVAWSSEHLRDVIVELESEEAVAPIANFTVDGSVKNLRSVFEDAGFLVTEGGLASEVPRKPGGWDDSELHTLMTDLWATPMLTPSWHLSLLLLSRSTNPHLNGVMFDTTATLPRQGAAVFATTIRGIPDIVHDRKIIQTAVHELGHALNLAHRFEREVGRADSVSHMAYDWRYKGGGHFDEFWQLYRFQFDPDELSFIRHGVRPSVIPGGARFHSVRYWADGDGGFSLYVPELPLPEFELRLAPPPTPFFQLGQPVLLEVSLRNLTDGSFDLPTGFLDPKGHFLELLIRRHRTDDPTGLRAAEPFVPLVQRCYDQPADAVTGLGPGETMTDNLNLTFGSSGFSFAEPGIYDVTALLAIPKIENGKLKAEWVTRSNPQRIQIAHPTRVEEHDLADLFDGEVGAYFALGGSPALYRAADKLATIQERRGDDPADPIVANIIRCRGIEAQRSPVRYDAASQRFQVLQPDLDEAARQLGRLDEPALAQFDKATASATRELAEAVKKG
jgi:hypothetical protein